MQSQPRHKKNIPILVWILIGVMLVCPTFSYIQFVRGTLYVNDLAGKLGLSAQDRLTPPYRHCINAIPSCGVYVNYQITRTQEQFMQDLRRWGRAGEFYGGFMGGLMESNLSDAGIGHLYIDEQVISNENSIKLPQGSSLVFVDGNGQNFNMEWYRTGSSISTFALNDKQIRGDVITIIWQEYQIANRP